MTERGVAEVSQVVSFAPPATSGGQEPVTVACNPASGSSFPLGMSSVACIATDALSREASCSFTVALTGNTLGARIFDAVGDSLTEGENGHISVLDIPNAYPTRLQAALEATYPGQGIKVVNRGVSGYPVDRTVEEIPGDLSRDQPDAVLLLSGYNNLLVECGGGPANTADCRDAIDAVRFGIRDCIRRSREGPSAARYTFVSTLTPPGPVSGARDRHISNDADHAGQRSDPPGRRSRRRQSWWTRTRRLPAMNRNTSTATVST